uniref:Uncharacterized protein n=1 Tax=Picea glauca TaxID=3330 RepID=A0A101LZ74_PICGL|nr:hypothetical protein ABT39_MTgene5075 [Picea glauca]QHR87701.1 hypothetical protein Q903MT_gene1713 [Picea sitchensis]
MGYHLKHHRWGQAQCLVGTESGKPPPPGGRRSGSYPRSFSFNILIKFLYNSRDRIDCSAWIQRKHH